MVTLPGEPLLELGWEVYNDTLKMGFDTTFLAGYSNNHMGYFATPNEYGRCTSFFLFQFSSTSNFADVGGYESQLSFWGRDTAELIRAGCSMVASQIKPTMKKAKPVISL